MPNPIFPINEYIPDGEPHVFGDRVYLYGSHDAQNGDRFCMKDYTVYSAPVDDLENWTCHNTSYRKNQDPRSKKNALVDYYAPDCVQGNDGRYYLYYFAAGPETQAFGPMSVAVGEQPEGPFNYLGDIQYADGTPVLQYMTNDPAVINDNGRIWLYYGWGLGRDLRSKLMAPILNRVQSKILNRSVDEIKKTRPSILSCAVVEMEEDMITVKGAPKAVLDSKTTADKKSALYQHAFYEAASIRKFNGLFYLIYSSGENCELAYATSTYPDGDFTYRGVLISNSDLGYQGNTKYKAAGGTIHGSVEYINGQYYVFYHRCTNNTNFSRQACAEPITMNGDRTFNMVEITTQGLHNKPLEARRIWQAWECCNLYNDKTSTVLGNGHNHDAPTIVYEEGEHFITAIDDGTVVGYKYLDFAGVKELRLTYRGDGGKVEVLIKEGGEPVGGASLEAGSAEVSSTEAGSMESSSSESVTTWREVTIPLTVEDGVHPLFLQFRGTGKIDLLQFIIC